MPWFNPSLSSSNFPGGEVPLAFVVLTANAAKRANEDANTAQTIKNSIMKVLIPVVILVNFSHQDVACFWQQSPLQEISRWCWICICNPHFAKRKIAAPRSTGAGKAISEGKG